MKEIKDSLLDSLDLSSAKKSFEDITSIFPEYSQRMFGERNPKFEDYMDGKAILKSIEKTINKTDEQTTSSPNQNRP